MRFRHVTIARGSLAEAETIPMLLVDVQVDVQVVSADDVSTALSLCTEISKMLTSLLNRVRAPENG